MSVVGGRVFVIGAVAVLVLCAGWVWAIPAADRWSASTAIPVVIGLVAAVAVVVGVALFARFGEARIVDDRVVLRAVLRPRRTVALADIADVVVLDTLVLPSRTGSAAVSRVLIRRRNARPLAVTPRDGELVRQLRAHGITVTSDAEPLTPGRAARRYPGAAAPAERLLGAMVWAAVIVPVVVVAWLLLAR